MKYHLKTLAQALTYSGALPLIACVIVVYFPVQGIDPMRFAPTYAAVIISFLCGIHWATYLFFADKCPFNLFLTSNILAVLAWSSLLIVPIGWSILIQILCFLCLLFIDSRLAAGSLIPVWFYTLRLKATVIVLISLLLIAYNL